MVGLILPRRREVSRGFFCFSSLQLSSNIINKFDNDRAFSKQALQANYQLLNNTTDICLNYHLIYPWFKIWKPD